MKQLYFMGSALKCLRAFPEEVKDDIGYALYQAQMGVTPVCAKALKGFGGGVLEIIEDAWSGTYRAVYTVQFAEAVYVLHCFQKKSKRASQTPPRDAALIEARLKLAGEHHFSR